MKLVIINSFGPMGSTTLASIIEKFGFQNIPLRKIFLTENVVLETNENRTKMLDRFFTIIKNHDKFRKQGGVSAIQRMAGSEVKLINTKVIFSELNNIKNSNISLPDLYYQLRETYQKSILYKDNKKKSIGYIELLINSHNFEPDLFVKSYQKKFNEVFFISLKRDFPSWLSSMSLQWYYKKKRNWRIFNIDKVYSDFEKYNNFVEKIPGLKINFDEIFPPNTNNLINKLQSYLNVNNQKVDWENQRYDLYGKLVPYRLNFNKFDDDLGLLSICTRKLILLKIKSSPSNKFLSICIAMSYFIDSFFIKLKIQRKLKKNILN